MKINLTQKIVSGVARSTGSTSSRQASSGQAIVLPLFSGSKPVLHKEISAENKKFIETTLKFFDGGEKSAKVLRLPEGKDVMTVVLLGLGDKKSWTHRKFFLVVRRIVGIAKSEKIKEVGFSLKDLAAKVADDEALKLIAVNLIKADYDFNKYKEVPKEGWPKIDSIYIGVSKINKKLEHSLEEGIIIGEEVNRSRDLANTPGGDMTPQVLANDVAQSGKRAGFTVKILDEKEIEKLGMGGVIGVSKGSSEKPRFIIAEYWGNPSSHSFSVKTSAGKKVTAGKGKNQAPLVFVGKGVTFDSGGINLKPGDSSYEMHMDMTGGASVIHALAAIARLKLKINVVALVPAVENMPSGSSYHPGDLLRTITGKTIEVLNTDAEGRVILADGLGYAQKYKPDLIVDVATLTGSAMGALGLRAMAIFTDDQKLSKKIQDLGEETNELGWPLPLWDEYFEDIKGTFGDVANSAKTRYGGAITSALFLKQFVGLYPWVHLDIAPTMTTIDGDYLAKGASGTAVQLLVELARTRVL